MRLFATPPYREVDELLDHAGEASHRDLEHTLRDIRRANIFGLGTWVVKHHLERLMGDWPPGHQLRILDLGTGSADIPEELCRWAERRGLDIRFVATDISPEVLKIARARIEKAGFGDRITFLACDAARPPFAPGSFDVVVCSLAFHHLSVKQACAAMPEIARIGRLGFIINDIFRSRGAWIMAWVLAHFTTTNRLTRHDGPASVSRAFTPAELRRMAQRAGLCVHVYRHPFWRVAVVGNGKRD
ncbi:MAG TPA: methyltransferase domain-containing protein [Chloroflexia bacterium]|nr:methyltransferase domain-containing protein [Chloroflexia bacterium]